MLKKAQVIMLPTNEKSEITLIDNKLEYKRVLTPWGITEERGSYIHLYFINNEEIKEGDWCIHNYGKGGIEQSKYNLKDKKDSLFEDYKKIIATTNPELLTVESDWIESRNNYKDRLPKIPQDFIEAYVREQGNIREVNLEYEYPNYLAKYEELKLRSDNTVIIHKVNKKMYSREELITACHNFNTFVNTEDRMSHIIINEWFDKHFPE